MSDLIVGLTMIQVFCMVMGWAYAHDQTRSMPKDTQTDAQKYIMHYVFYFSQWFFWPVTAAVLVVCVVLMLLGAVLRFMAEGLRSASKTLRTAFGG